jgi:DNA-binding NtrC family response regulator
MRTVLVIDDSSAVIGALQLLFELNDVKMLASATPEQGLEALAREQVDLVIADMNFKEDTTSGEEGVALFRTIRQAYPDLPVILLTAWTTVESAVLLTKAGAADYVSKPWDNRKLLATVENLLELSEVSAERDRSNRERRKRRRRLSETYELLDMIFESEPMERVVELACRVARAPVPVLITGPNGVGKERVAEIVHANSSVSTGPFVAVNCGALPGDLIEAELFGAEAGAYTGANRARIGRFEMANGGTLFLDEIGNLPLSGQIKLLRVVETGRFEQLGSSQTQQVNVRLISATNGDLPAMIEQGRFRQDLYYRLNLIEISVPALADREADILPLAEHFAGENLKISEDARSALIRYKWPGNVRELRNCIERARLLSDDGVVRVCNLNLPSKADAQGDGTPVRVNADELTREELQASLSDAGGNISRAAQMLGISRQSLYRRLERFGMNL